MTDNLKKMEQIVVNNFEADEISDAIIKFNTNIINKTSETRHNDENKLNVEREILNYLLTELEIILKTDLNSVSRSVRDVIIFQLGIVAGQLGIEEFYQEYGDRIIRLLQSENTSDNG